MSALNQIIAPYVATQIAINNSSKTGDGSNPLVIVMLWITISVIPILISYINVLAKYIMIKKGLIKESEKQLVIKKYKKFNAFYLCKNRSDDKLDFLSGFVLSMSYEWFGLATFIALGIPSLLIIFCSCK